MAKQFEDFDANLTGEEGKKEGAEIVGGLALNVGNGECVTTRGSFEGSFDGACSGCEIAGWSETCSGCEIAD